tara:strand:+ start:120 stop:767 length:648 start_codon:yes stop_codon:yes gene_type:complete
MIPKWCEEIISQVENKSSLEKRVVLVDSYLVSDSNYTEFVNESEYVIRLNPEVCIRDGNCGYKTDILFLPKYNFSPYSREDYKNNYNNFYKRIAFKESREIWLNPNDFWSTDRVGSQTDFSMVYDVDLLNFHVKHLYSHHKDNIKMISYDEYISLMDRIGSNPNDVNQGFFQKSSIVMEMMRLDSRFSDYEMFLCMTDITQGYIDDVFDGRIMVK